MQSTWRRSASRAQPLAESRRGDAADAGVDLVEDERLNIVAESDHAPG